MLKKYIELGTSNRCDPCQEYPGRWTVIVGNSEHIFSTYHEAFVFATDLHETEMNRPAASGQAEYQTVSICWQCSDNDPRIGQVWFTGFYRHGYFDIFGNYKT